MRRMLAKAAWRDRYTSSRGWKRAGDQRSIRERARVQGEETRFEEHRKEEGKEGHLTAETEG
jgi:hypothetical protein